MKRLRFITQFKIEFVLPFTGCRKALEKMLGFVDNLNQSECRIPDAYH